MSARPAPRSDNERWCGVVVDALVQHGLRHAVICPGSRSTPLALALADHDALDVVVVADERSAGFVALGLAKGSGVAPLLLCTSGTAGAHFYPAVIEAHLTGVPLLVVTADRPPELHDFGASQSIDQSHLFGAFARFTDLGLPNADPLALRHLQALAQSAMAASSAAASSSVSHWNAPFREPLAAPVDAVALPALEDVPAAAPRRLRARRVADPAAVDAVVARLARAERPLIVAGPRRADDEDAAVVVGFARAAGVPVLAELGSGLRRAEHADVVVAHGEQIVRAAFAPGLALGAPRPDLIVRTGLVSTTKALQSFVDAADTNVECVALGGQGAPVDPQHRADLVVDGDVFAALRAAVAARQAPPPTRWLSWWKRRDAVVAAALDAAVAGALDGGSASAGDARAADERAGDAHDLDECGVARVVVASAVGSLVLASSMPIRDAEAFGGLTAASVVVNRGAAGIDGLVSTTVGVARATRQPATLLCGDLALLHDLHGLVAARDVDVIVVVVNNDGGGIFSFLPVAGRVAPSRFEQLFGAPHGLGFKELAAFAGATLYAQPTSLRALSSALAEARARGGLALIEVRTDRRENAAAHERAFSAVRRALEGA